MSLVMEILVEWLLATVAALGVVSFAAGVVLVCCPPLIRRAGRVLDRWIATDRWFAALDVRHGTERFWYRHHRVTGFVMTAGGAYLLWALVFALDRELAARHFLVFDSLAATRWIVDSSAWLLGLAALAALLLGPVVVVRPSALRRIETWANRWMSGSGAVERLDRTHAGAHGWLLRHPRISGISIIIASLYIFFYTGRYLW